MNAKILNTPSGPIRFPAYVPVTTFGGKYPLDALIQPYLPRLAPALMVSHHYARQMREKPRLPVMIDSGGFAALFEGSKIIDRKGLGILETHLGEQPELLTPWDVLEFQEQQADIAFTLDFPIPPNLPIREARRRQKLTIANARWALENRRRKEMRLFACIQAWDVASASKCVKELATMPFDGFAIGGLVPRAKDWDLISEIVQTVRTQTGDRPLHVFGLGKPETASRLFNLGVDSVDSSSYVKAAADGVSWRSGVRLPDATTPERLRFALENLAQAADVVLPLSARR